MPPSTRRALAWSFAERYASLLVNILTTMILARLLTPAEVGVYSLCASFTAVAGILRDFGVSEYLIQEKDLTRDKIRSAYGLALVFAWALAALMFFSRHSLADFYGHQGVASVLAVLALNFLLLPLSSPTYALLNKEMAFRQLFFLNIVCTVVHSLTAVWLALAGFGFMSLAWAPVANVATQTLILFIARPSQSFVLPSFKAARTVLRFGAMFVSARAIEVFGRNSHELVIGKQFDFASVGIFSRAFGLVDLFNSNVSAAIIRVATPAFAAEHHAGVNLAERFANATALYTGIAWPIFGFLALGAHEIIAVMFGEQWLRAAPIASILIICVAPNCLSALAPQLLSATGNVGSRLRIALQNTPIHLTAVLLASFHSLEAVAAAFLAGSVCSLLLYMRALKRVLKAPARQLFGPAVASIWVSAACVGTQSVLLLVLRTTGAHALLVLTAVAVAGALSWLLFARWVRHPAFDEVATLAAKTGLLKMLRRGT